MRGRTQLASIEELLTTLGIDPHAVADLILTHAHYDHAGNLDLFSNAQITVSHSEMEFWEGKNAGKTLFHHALDENGITALQRARSEGRLRTFNGSIEVAPGIEVLEVGGHTPGQCLVKVKTREGNVLLASDAVHYYEELEREMPFSSVADIVAMYDAFALIKELTASGEISSVISGHDPDTLSRFPQTFSTGPLSELFATIGGAS
jgi:glyoxylase-like metal-dependent hydrolase (beta-lactamase superfamily II)